MADLLTGGPELIYGAPLREALKAEQQEFFGDLERPAGVRFIVPLAECGLRAYDAATETYASNQVRYAATVNVLSEPLRRHAAHIAETLHLLGQDERVDGIILGEPVPSIVDLNELRAAMPVDRDIDGVNPDSPYRLRRPTPSAMLHVPKSRGIDLATTRNLVLGAKGAIGSALVAMLTHRGISATALDRKDEEVIPDAVMEHDVIFSAARATRLITPAMLYGAEKLVVDATVLPSPDGDGIEGSVDPAAYTDTRVRASITPVPGGIGLLDNAMLCQNLLHTFSHSEATA